MIPLTVTAYLGKPPAVDQPIYLDAAVLAGLGAEMSGAHPSGIVSPAEVVAAAEDGALPLARVETPHGWWWAASAVVPFGPERKEFLVRRPPLESYARLTDRASLQHKAGPDKMLRTPFFYRPEMSVLRWTCVGERGRLAELLARVPALGRYRGHGWGWVRRWEIERGGPPLKAYATDLRLRHLPTDLQPDTRGIPRWTSRRMPLRPPYFERVRGEMCLQSL